MGRYLRGDVILAPVPFEERGGTKTRPAIVVSAAENGDMQICPVSSRPSTDAPCVPISLNDFSEGGLDLFSDSYALPTRVRTIRSSEVVGKRGRLTPESMAEIAAYAPALKKSNPDKKKRSG